MKLALTRIVLWFVVSIVLFQTLLAALKPDASWTDYASLAVALACLLFVYTKVLAHFAAARANEREDDARMRTTPDGSMRSMRVSSGRVVGSRVVAVCLLAFALYGIFAVPSASMSPVLRWSHDWLRWPMAIVNLLLAIHVWRNPIDLVRSKPPPFATHQRGREGSHGSSG